MQYIELSKLYYKYKGEAEYAEEYKKRFNSEDTIHLDFNVAGKPAFFVVNTEVLKLAYNIARVDKEVSKLSACFPGVAKEQYSKKCLIDEIVLTNKIEGVKSSRKEIGDALDIIKQQSKNGQKHPRFTGIVNKYYKLMKNEQIPVECCQDIRDIYNEVCLEEVMEENPDNVPDGKIFRKQSESIYSETGKEIHTGIYPESEIINAMEKAIAFFNDKSVDELFRICIFHYLIEYIHPFYDGNGRLGRFILSYSLSKYLEPLLAYRISRSVKENIKAYYKAFEICNDPHNLADLTPFLIMQLKIIDEAIKDLEDALAKRLIRWGRYLEMIDSLPNASDEKIRHLYDYLIEAALFSEDGISTSELKVCFEVSSTTTIKNYIDKIPEKLLISKIKNRVKYYEIDLRVLDDILLKQS